MAPIHPQTFQMVQLSIKIKAVPVVTPTLDGNYNIK
jgi:hypothetical protein